MLEFITDHYLIIMIVSLFLIFALIGYIIDSTRIKKRSDNVQMLEKEEDIPSIVNVEEINETPASEVVETPIPEVVETPIPEVAETPVVENVISEPEPVVAPVTPNDNAIPEPEE